MNQKYNAAKSKNSNKKRGPPTKRGKKINEEEKNEG